ncbi:MAG: mechanosensitive ion channel [Phycisphaerae bacterium]|nr:mechanosensitive ion channel [Phycisphaerae bacterium]
MTILANFLQNAWNWAEDVSFLDNAALNWFAMLGCILVSMFAGKIVSFVLLNHAARVTRSRKHKILGMFLRSMAKPASLLIFSIGLYIGGLMIAIEEEIQTFYDNVCETIGVIAVLWFIFKLVDIVEILLKKVTGKTETTLDDQLVPLIRKALRVFVIVVGLLYIATNIFGQDIGALLAGLGLGGLAFALAAKDTIANMFGSLTIFIDKPFKLGDRVKLKGVDGVVEEVGFRSTRLRQLNGHLTVIPNGVITNETIENVSRRPYLKRVLDVTVTYDTTPEMIRRGVEILHEMLDARADSFHPDQPYRVFFTEFNADSLSISVMYWYAPPDWWEYLAFNHDFNMELLKRFNDEGIEFAFPTQTLYLKEEDK